MEEEMPKHLPAMEEKEEVVRRIHERLVLMGSQEALSSDDFRRQLSLHFGRLPRRYLIDMSSAERAEDVLLHLRILADCAHPGNRPVVHARFRKCIQVALDYDDGPEAGTESRGPKELLLHEIIFASIDKTKLLSQRSALMSDVGLNIREAHVYSTPDGFSLIIFLVDGWRQQEADGLLKAIKETIARREAPRLPSTTDLGRILPPRGDYLNCSKG